MTQPEHRNIACLDGLRGFACVLVLFSHAGWQKFFYFVNGLGPLGISLFFTLSGFLMAYHYMPGRFLLRYWLEFLIRRIFRIYPVYALVLLLYWSAHAMFPTDTFLSNFTFHNSLQHFLLHMGWYTFWTIPVEMRFYALFPALACGCLLLSKYSRYASTLLWGWLLFAPIHYGILGPYLFFFIGGTTAALWYKYYCTRQHVPHRIWNIFAWGCVCFIVSIIMLIFSTLAGYQYTMDYAWYFSPVMAITIVSVIESTGIVQRILSSNPARFTGKISYSLYLIHDFIFHYSAYYQAPVAIKFLINFTMAFLAAWMLYELVEKPFIRLGKVLAEKITRRSATIPY